MFFTEKQKKKSSDRKFYIKKRQQDLRFKRKDNRTTVLFKYISALNTIFKLIMTKEERQSIILELLIQHNSILVTDLATHLNVSSVTIRKDLTDLEREKKLYRNHGKAILIDPYIDNRNVSEKEKLYVEEKRLIGMKAASLIAPKDSILIASGTTMHALARSIVPVDELTVITASMEVSNILASEKNIYIIQLGGILRHSSLSVVGKYAENILADFSCSKLFIGVDGIDLDFGITTTNMMEASLNRVMMQTAQKTIVLADSSKFGRRGFSKISDMEDVDHIITDSRIPPSTALRLEEMGIELTIADAGYHNNM